MRRHTNVAVMSLGLLLGTSACDTFLTGNSLSTDPNRPTSASIQQLFVGVQAGQFAFEEGTVAMMMCEWVQACGAANGRFVQQAAQYVFNESSNIAANFGDWISVYDAGGLIDIRGVEAKAIASGDSTYLGIAKIWEAFTIGTASDMWGDIPYSQAGVNPTPVLDNRFVILGGLQTLLDQAIAELQNASGPGPTSADLVFGGNRTNWIGVANTLKARYFMHTAESLGTPAYQAAITAATNGISDPTGKSDFASFHSSATSERNMWAQFQTSSGFGTDLEAGKFMVDRMNNRKDPRLASYFCKNVTTAWQPKHAYVLGARILGDSGYAEVVTVAGTSGSTEPVWPATSGTTITDSTVTWTNQGLPYAGDDPTSPQSFVSSFSCLPPRFSATARIPYVSYVENELILAEANQATGNDAVALTHLNNARAYVNTAFPAKAPLVALSPLVGVVSPALLDSIMIEKYFSLFQNIESMSDYRRTCIPRITPAHNTQGFTRVPGRLFYPLNERNVNPNIPDPSTQLGTHGFRNAGDVNPCPIPAP
jgi:starch-binding outer membrane protein, SusD/RagB family